MNNFYNVENVPVQTNINNDDETNIFMTKLKGTIRWMAPGNNIFNLIIRIYKIIKIIHFIIIIFGNNIIEMIKGDVNYNEKVDIYSFGIIKII